jgi:hypothetical protein
MNYRPKQIISLVGNICLSRPYYHCKHCHAGMWPWDEKLCLSPERLTPGAQEVTTLGGISHSFGKTADRILKKMTGLNLSESTVERTTEAAGARLGTRLDQGEVFGPKVDWEWHQDLEGKTCAYVSLDATGIMMQGEGGAKAEGRMVNVGMIFNPQPRAVEDEDLCKPCDGARYLAGLYTLPELGLLMRRQGAQVGMDRVDQWIALTDAGNGLDSFMEVNFPLAIRIVDFRHASEYVHDFAKAYRAGKEGESLADTWCHQLKHEGGASLLTIFEALPRDAMTPTAQEQYDKTLSYYRNHHDRMDYPTYLAKGWQIGTGGVESACKTVINARLSMGGMRWGEDGSDAVCHLRALYCSQPDPDVVGEPDQWDAFWSDPRPTKPQAKKAA